MAHFCSNTSLPRVTDPAAGWPVDFFVPLLAGGSCAATAVAMARTVVPTITKFRLTISLLRLLQSELPANADFDLVPKASIFPFCLRSEERRVGKECRSRWSPYH